MERTEVEKASAAFRAVQAYYASLADQAARAIHGEVPAPIVPPLAELQVVDGWVVWSGRPVWSPRDDALTDSQPVRYRWTPSLAQSAYNEALERRLDATQAHLKHAAERASRGSPSPEAAARLQAEAALYASLVEQQRRAIRDEAAPPEVPPAQELAFVDGWLVWKGRKVWWSGYRSGSEVEHGAENPAPRAPVLPRSAAEARPGWRQLFRLPWQRAA
jgi:hypothetical protein